MIRPLGELFETEPKPAHSGIETIEEFLALLLELEKEGDREHGRERGGGTNQENGRGRGERLHLLAVPRGRRPFGDGQRELVHAESLPARPAQYAELQEPLPRALAHVLDTQGIARLYSHQAQAIDLARAGKHVVVATGTASGKSLAYHIPVLERLLLEPQATALYLFPTKALAQDQLRGLLRFADNSRDLGRVLATGTYDGDTPGSARRKLRETGNAILTNPDMLHQGILPYHARWARFFSSLRYIVVDEVHTYRGIFGSHVANVLRRLRRIARHYGAEPQFLCSSATLRNPKELAELIVGDEVHVVDQDGSPRGPKLFVLWNPRQYGPDSPERRSASIDAERILVALLKRGVQSIVFTKARVVAELIYRYARERLEREDGGKDGGESGGEGGGKTGGLADLLSPYRGGYLPEERRAIERRLFSGELRGVISTNALELGIDVGTLDASILVGFPNTIASTWQQAGRSGRKQAPSFAVVVAYEDPVDQYLMRHPQYFFGQTPESAVLDPENPYVLASQLSCATYELPLSEKDEALFGSRASAIASLLEEEGSFKSLDGLRYWSSAEYPAGSVNLRTISDDTFTILDQTRDNAVLGTVDAISAPELVYPEAIYLHEGDTYLVRELDLKQKIAYVEPRQVDYYTQPVLDTNLKLEETRESKRFGDEAVGLGPAAVSWQTVAMKKIRFRSLDAIGYHPLDLPRQRLDTMALWIQPSDRTRAAVKVAGLNPREGMSGLRNLLITILPLHVMCDRPDIGGILDSSNLGEPSIFLYDRYPGGLGYAERGYAIVGELLSGALRLVEDCPCEIGCPSCVGLPILRPAQQQDPDLYGGWPIPSRAATEALLRRMLGR